MADIVRVVLVDDHPVVRDGLRGMISGPGIEVVAEAADGVAAVALIERLDPDLALMDLRMPGGGGVDAIAEIGRRGLRCRVLVLTTYGSDADTVPAIEAGATGYLLKDAPKADLVAGIRAAAAGEPVLSPAIAARLMSRVRVPAGDPLSDREREVLALVAKGTSNPRSPRRCSSARPR